MYETIYEIERVPMPIESIVEFLFVIVYFTFACVRFADAINIINTEKRLSFKCLGKMVGGMLFFVGVIVFGIMLIDSFTYGGSDDYEFSEKYYKGEYSVVIGKVENFVAKYSDDKHMHLEEFTVKDVYFDYGHAYKVGFQNIGEVIYKNGQEVKICYIPVYDGNTIMNVIVKIEEKISD